MAALWLVLCGPAAGDAPAAPLSPPPAVLRAAGDAPAVHPAAAAPAPPRAPIKKTPIPQGDAYRFDAEYQKLQRYDFLPYLLS
ncbi:MAG: hypothetical protein ACE5DO_15335, partial [Desulfobacterales bacterium]